MKLGTAWNKARRVVESCTTEDQLPMARKFAFGIMRKSDYECEFTYRFVVKPQVNKLVDNKRKELRNGN